MSEPIHTSVLLKESIDHLNLRAGQTVVDCTLGLGGHSLEILKKIGSKGHLIVFEQDEENLKTAKERLKKFEKQITYIDENFENLKSQISNLKLDSVDAVLMDLGLSSPHVDNAERGFSFKNDGPLDMRFDKRQTLTAEKVVNSYKENDLADIIFKYGEERKSRIIARKIIEERKIKPIKTTAQLAEIIKKTIRTKSKTHPATCVFQALRIYINRELEVLEKTLDDAINLLKPKGRIVVISYHSLEDRIVKQKFKYYTKDCICPKELPLCQCNFQKKLYILTKRPIIPNSIEVAKNPRARSAKMRVAEAI
ncbi:16S rRNA (cytosine(1402)-N(4))-methyltransferase RsmH [Candidatus Peregrinibacteria bacterium]|nr:16S rRNA (cytosine(1402)-N(4))-methyltransferase RsmH [Candidatus Peregrinibacteria bacterium]